MHGLRFSKWSYFTTLAAVSLVGLGASAQNGTLSGIVTDDQGAAVSCAAIIVDGPDEFRRSTTTDAAGFYSLADVPPGDYMVQVHAPGFELPEDPAVTKVPQRVEIPATVMAGQDTDVDFAQLTQRNTGQLRVIQGFVLLEGTDQAIPDCEMFVRTPDCDVMDVTFTCREGLYEFVVPDDVTGPVDITFQLPDFEPVGLTIMPLSAGMTMADDIFVPNIDTTQLGSILGAVTDASGTPIAEANVTVGLVAKQTQLTTNCDGDFNALRLTPASYLVTVSAPGFADAEQTVAVVAGAEGTFVEFMLAPPAGLFECPGDENNNAVGEANILGDSMTLMLALGLCVLVSARRRA